MPFSVASAASMLLLALLVPVTTVPALSVCQRVSKIEVSYAEVFHTEMKIIYFFLKKVFCEHDIVLIEVCAHETAENAGVYMPGL